LHRIGASQIFVPLTRINGSIVATREFFPQTMRLAIRQRTRWITGIGLQTWERHGWAGSPTVVYWLWRDRKGLIGNPVSLITNLIFLYGAVTWSLAHFAGYPWGLAKQSVDPSLLTVTMTMQGVQTIVRMICSGRIYGFRFALAVPIRTVFANLINATATIRALHQYCRARLLHEPLVWLKTDHAYPSRGALVPHKRRLGEILVGSAYISEEDLQRARDTKPAGMRIGEYLVWLGLISEEELYEALSLQQSLPLGKLAPMDVNMQAARALPRHVMRQCKVLPIRIAGGSMLLASPEIPTDELSRTLRGFTRMALRFQLVTQSNFAELTSALL
jgi:adsorption protein B